MCDRSPLSLHSFDHLCISLFVVFILQAPLAFSVVVPSSNCYVLDNSSYIYDFTDWIGHVVVHDGEDADLVVRFCKDVESRSQKGYIDFGRFATSNDFGAGSGPANFVQEFYNGDLASCEGSYDKRGRTAQVNIICGGCLNGMCQGKLGCICNVTYDSSMCRAVVELAIPCQKRGSRVFKGFTVGFHPRSWEVVYNGLTQLGFEKASPEFSFGTQQTQVALYLTAISALSGSVGKPVFKHAKLAYFYCEKNPLREISLYMQKTYTPVWAIEVVYPDNQSDRMTVYPNKGLEVKLSGSGANGSPPTTLSPTILIVNWRCEMASDTPYEVAISIPVEGYEPVEFTLSKICEYRQDREGGATRGWATFGVLSCVFFILSTLFCCGGFVYKTRVEHQHGLDALPGMTILSACLETVSGGGGGYSRADNLSSAFVNQTSWEHVPVSAPAQGAERTNERKYGSI